MTISIIFIRNIGEAISLSERVVVLTKRPCKIKKIYNIELENPKLPTSNRRDPKFSYYYDLIWRDLDVNI